ncbi:MAG: exopolyphosphatase, partial [Gammaproteobacteria bacterium]|nr:exopolyphosphatase [Gammaproteobacteria bacterium]
MIAAVDLGSNSFHMVVAEERQGQLVILDRIKDMVRLGEGLDDDNNLNPEVAQRALESLERFGQRLREIPAENVSAVGTNTLRRAQQAEQFLQDAEEKLGHTIEIISGIEEARLIYQGVAHSLEPDQKRKLVVDIGGGSTELIIGEGFQPMRMNSLEMGCVSMTRQFFADGLITEERIERARVKVLQQLKAIRYGFLRQGWDVVIGSSGSIRSVANIIREMSLSQEDGISIEALATLVKQLKNFKHVDQVNFAGLTERRAPVFAGGAIVLMGVFEALDISHMQVSDGAVREGLLYDMLGRRHAQDIRNQTAKNLALRFHADTEHAQRIEATACGFLQQLKQDWSLQLPEAERLLRWACELHEIGYDISASDYHRHGAYIIENSDLAGFSQQEQRRLAHLVAAQKGKLNDRVFEKLRQSGRQLIFKLAVLLRLAIIFHRSRVAVELPSIKLGLSGNEL